MTESTIYWLTRLDAINILFHSLGVLLFIALFILFAMYVSIGLIKGCLARWNHDDHIDPGWRAANNYQKVIRSVMLCSLILTVVLLPVQLLIPTTHHVAEIRKFQQEQEQIKKIKERTKEIEERNKKILEEMEREDRELESRKVRSYND